MPSGTPLLFGPLSVIGPGPVRVATTAPLRIRRTWAPGSAGATSKAGFLALVTLSVLLAPESLAAWRAGTPGTNVGGVLSIVTCKAPPIGLELPARSTWIAV